MSSLELPHSAECLVCGRGNPRGLKLSFHVDPIAGNVTTRFEADQTLCGFADIVHGGLIATVFDEAMVWAANWTGKRFCVCGELYTRFLRPAKIGQRFDVTAVIESARPRLIQTRATMRDIAGQPVATATAKYVPLSAELNQTMISTMLREPATAAALERFTKGNDA